MPQKEEEQKHEETLKEKVEKEGGFDKAMENLSQRQNEAKSKLQHEEEEEDKPPTREDYLHKPTRDNSQAELALVIVALIILLLLVQRCRKGESGIVQNRREDE